VSAADSTLLLGKHPVKISLEGHRGAVVVSVRRQFVDGSGALRPSYAGINFPAQHLPDVIRALERLQAQMVADGAMDSGDPPKYCPHVYPRDF
jgi:hypothetical protein